MSLDAASAERTPMKRFAFTLMEVIIALAILGVAMTVLLEVSSLSLRNARLAVLETEAAIVAEAVLGELEAGTAELQDFSGQWTNDTETSAAEWNYEVVVQNAQVTGLLSATITITQATTAGQASDSPVSFSMVRWFQDPSYLAQFASSTSEEG